MSFVGIPPRFRHRQPAVHCPGTIFMHFSNYFQSFIPNRMNNPMFAATSEHETNEFLPPMAFKRARAYEPESRGPLFSISQWISQWSPKFLEDQNHVKTPLEVCGSISERLRLCQKGCCLTRWRYGLSTGELVNIFDLIITTDTS